MASIPCAKSSLRLLHNGKGRPVMLKVSARFLSSNQSPLSRNLRSSRCLAPTSTCLHHHPRRFASSTASTASPTPPLSAASPVAAAPPPVAAESVPAGGGDWNSIFDNITASTVSVEPHIGYLKELGIDFGWGTTSMIQWFVEHVHVWSGMPWFGSIVASVLIYRVAILRYNINAADQAGRMAVLAPHMKPLQDKMKAAQAAGDQAGMLTATNELKALYKSGNVRPFSIFLPVLLQIPWGFGLWRLTRNMADLPVPGLDQGGALWFTDLTVADPYYILPLATSFMMYTSFKRGGEMGSNATTNPTMFKVGLYVLPSVSLFITATFPAATQVVFFTTSAWTLVQTSFMRSNKVRDILGIQPLPPQNTPAKSSAAAPPTGPYKGTISKYEPPSSAEQHSNSKGGLGARWQAMKEQATEWMAARERKPSSTRISAAMKKKAQAYEAQRRAEIEAAKEQLAEKRRNAKGRVKL